MNTFDADGRLAIGQSWFEQFEQKQQERFRPDDFVDAYHKTQRDMVATYSQGYRQPAQRDWGQTVSAGINMVPVVGGLKIWAEDYTRKDLWTGQRLDRTSLETFLGVTLNFASAMPVGIMGQAANGAKFSTGYANWQTRNIAAWKTAPESMLAVEAGTLKRSSDAILSGAEKKLYERITHFPKSFDKTVWERSIAKDGNVYNPDGRIMKFEEPWQFGHKPEHKLSDAQMRAAREGWTRQQWIRYQQDPDIYQPEIPRTNESHEFEKVFKW